MGVWVKLEIEGGTGDFTLFYYALSVGIKGSGMAAVKGSLLVTR